MTTATTLDQLLQRIASLTDADAMTIAAVDNVGGLASLEACSSLEVAVIACCDAAITDPGGVARIPKVTNSPTRTNP